jgi:hypothetical protein
VDERIEESANNNSGREKPSGDSIYAHWQQSELSAPITRLICPAFKEMKSVFLLPKKSTPASSIKPLKSIAPLALKMGHYGNLPHSVTIADPPSCPILRDFRVHTEFFVTAVDGRLTQFADLDPSSVAVDFFVLIRRVF